MSFTKSVASVFLISKHWDASVVGLLLCLPSMYAVGADTSQLVTGPELGLPSMGRVVVGFLLVALLAILIIAGLKRLKQWTPATQMPSLGVTVLGQSSLSRNVQVHVVESHGERFMIVSSSQHVVVTPLSAAETITLG